MEDKAVLQLNTNSSKRKLDVKKCFDTIKYFLFALLYVVLTDSMWTYTWENRVLYNTVNILLVTLAFIVFLSIFVFSHTIYLKETVIMMLQVVSIILCMMVSMHLSGGYLVKISFALVGFSVAILLDFHKLMKGVVQAITFLAIWSLVLYVMDFLKLSHGLPVVKNGNGLEFYHTIFAILYKRGDTITRNWGIFWEPGAFAIYLCVGVIIDLFYLKDKLPIIMIILSVTIVTTMSTTGILCLGIILLTYLFFHDKLKLNANKITIILAIIGGLCLVIFSEKFFNMVFGKLTGDLSQSASFSARFYSIPGNLKIIFGDGFLFGTGIEDYDAIYRQVVTDMGYKIDDFSNTNTFLVDLARFGWIYGIVELCLFFVLSQRLGSNNMQVVMIFVTFFIMLSMENLSYSAFFMTMPLLAFDYKSKYDVKEVRRWHDMRKRMRASKKMLGQS